MKPAQRLFALQRWFAVLAVSLAANSLEAASTRPKAFDLAAGNAEKTLPEFARQAGVELIFTVDKVEGVKTNAVRGRLSIPTALAQLLEGTGLGVVRDEMTDALAVQRIPVEPPGRIKRRLPLWPSAQKKTEKETAITLSPFTINTSKDRGYLATNTLSGFGIDTPIMKLPQTIQIANRQLIEDLGVGSGDLLSALEVASSSIVRRSFNNGDDQFMWGFRISSSARDGVPTGSTNALGVFYDIDRVEAVKGPAATLFGQASFIGGVINYVPRLPSKTRKRSAAIAVGSWGLRSGEIHLAGPVNDRLRYRADFGLTDKQGERIFTFWKDKFAGAAFEYDLRPGTTVLLEGHHLINDRANSTTLAEGELKDGRYAAPHRLLGQTLSLNTPEDQAGYERDSLSAKLNTVLPGGFAAQTFVNWTRLRLDMWRSQGRFQADGYDPVTRVVGREALRFQINESAWFYRQSLQKNFSTGSLNHNLTLSVETLLRNHADAVTFYALAPLDLTNPDYSLPQFRLPNDRPENSDNTRQARTRNSGATFNDSISLWEKKVNLLYSLRYSEARQVDTGVKRVAEPNPFPPALTKNKMMSRRYGVTIEPIENLLFYFNRGSAFVFYSSLDFTNQPFQPSIATNDEIGAKATFLEGALALTLTRFRIDVTNVRVVDGRGIRQDGFQLNQGWDVSINLAKRLGAGEANVIVTGYAGDVKNEFGQKPIHAVNHTWSVWGTFRLGSGPWKGFKAGLGANYTGERVGNLFHAQLGGGPTRIEAYLKMRAMVAYTWRNFTLQVNADNLTNVDAIDGYEHSLWITTESGRRYRTTLSYSF